MGPSTRALVSLSAALAAGDRVRLDAALGRAVAVCRPAEVEEALLQSYLFLGYPAALNALARWRERSGVEASGVEAPGNVSGGRDAEASGTDMAERGERVCRAVYAGQYERLRANVRRLHPDMERWMVEEGYGRVLGRPGLELAVRELCIVALLAVLDAPKQLYSHLRGALNVGASPGEVEAALAAAAEVSDEEARARARDTWASLRARRDDDEGV